MSIRNVVHTENIKRAAAVSLALILTACGGGGGGGGGGGDPVASAINAAGDYTVDESTVGRTEVPVVDSAQKPVINEVSINNTDWLCTEKEVTVEEAPQEFVLFADSSFQGIYPGAMLQGKSLDQDPPSPVRADRGLGTVTMPIFTGEPGVNRVTVDEVNSGNITTAINTMVAGRTLTPASFSYKATRVESREELRIAMGMQTGAFTKVSINTSFESVGTKEHWVIKMVQPFYSVQYEASNDWFADGVTAAELANDMGEGNPPVYVSSVTYGRIVYLVVTTDSSETETKLRIDFSSAVTDAALSVDYLTSLTNTSIEALVYGGGFDKTASLLTGDFEEARAALTVPPDFSLAKPIAYTMADVKNGRNVKVKLGDSFTVRDCYPSVGVRLNYAARQDLGITSVTDAKTGDFNGDGQGDLLLASITPNGDSPWRVAVSNGDGSYQLGDQFNTTTGAGDNSIHVADLDGDNYDDVVLQNQNSGIGTLNVIPNNNGTFMVKESGIYCDSIFWPNADVPYKMYAGRFLDGKDSLLWNYTGSGGFNVLNVTSDQMWENCPNGLQGVSAQSAPLHVLTTEHPFGSEQPVLVGDINNDGLDDLFVGAIVPNGTAWIWRTVPQSNINQAPPFQRLYTDYQTGRLNGSWEYGVGDVNDDGYADFVMVASTDGDDFVTVIVYSGNASAGLVYHQHWYYELPKGHYKVLLANFNGAFGAETLLLYKESEPNTLYALRNFGTRGDGGFGTIGIIHHENPDLLSITDWSNYEPLIQQVNDDNLDDIVWVRKGDASVSVGLSQPLQ